MTVKEAGAPRAGGTLSFLKYTLLIVSLIFASWNRDHPTHREYQAARALVNRARGGFLKTPGLIRDWCRRLWFLPDILKTMVWSHLPDTKFLDLHQRWIEYREQAAKDI